MATNPDSPHHWGLSPRVRGNQSISNKDHGIIRSIPACAGEPLAYRSHANQTRVYPRVCGGTRDSALLQWPMAGLSPRVRGNHRSQNGARNQARSIPACAGEPRPGRARPPSTRVYPRVCGGTGRDGRAQLRLDGLSPRVRGNHAVAVLDDDRLGSIPACAGEPGRAVSRRPRSKVYPRVCGGTETWIPIGGSTAGLSPRVRGNRSVAEGRRLRIRSIPACAGEPLVWSAMTVLVAVYPRVCGGTYESRRGVRLD